MGLLQECPRCHHRYSLKRKVCSCGFKFEKASGKIYWIEYYLDGHRRRERIGRNKQAAEQRLREVLSARTEGRYIKRAKNFKVSFDEIAKWYLQLPQIKAKRSYSRDELSMRTLSVFFAGKKVNELTTNLVEAYRQERLKQKARGKRLVMPATVNREIACLRHALNLALQEKLIDEVPFRIKSLKEDNVRDRVLSDDEFRKLVGCCLPHLARIVVFAYYTAMRKDEILSLDWSEVDLDEGFIYLKGSKTKSGEGRMVPLNNEVVEMLRSMKGNRTGRVFTLNGKPLKDVKRAFATACRKAGIENFRFHDLRHTCINNWRLQGHDFFRIMAASGHKTMSVFKRYNIVLKKELRALVVPPMDTNMDTKKEKGLSKKQITH